MENLHREHLRLPVDANHSLIIVTHGSDGARNMSSVAHSIHGIAGHLEGVESVVIVHDPVSVVVDTVPADLHRAWPHRAVTETAKLFEREGGRILRGRVTTDESERPCLDGKPLEADLIVIFTEAQRKIPVQYGRTVFRGGQVRRAAGTSRWPHENYYGWLVNARIDVLRSLL